MSNETSKWKITNAHILRYGWMRQSTPNDAAAITLRHGLVAWVSIGDFSEVAFSPWHVKANKRSVYAVTTSRARTKQGEKIGLHRIVMGDIDGMMVDHINGNTLDCRRPNLRHVTALQNTWNYHGATRGVKPHRTDAGTLTTKWRASIKRGRRVTNLGLYETREGAVRARLAAEQEVRSAIGI